MSGQGKPRGKGDYTKVGETSEPMFVRLPEPQTLFAARASRLAVLAEGNSLEPYLAFLSRLVATQHAAQAALPPAQSLPGARLAQQFNHAMPPLSSDLLADDPSFAAALDWICRHGSASDAPPQAEQARARLHAMPWPERLGLAEAVFEAAYPAEQLGECLYVAAALQVRLAQHAARLEPARLRPVGDGVCPVCGRPPVASMVVGWAGANRARYCCCSLCGTMWNYVRIKCTSCGGTGGIAYYAIEAGPSEIAAETCDTCGTYIKHLHQHKNPQLEPFADDLASFGLDLLVREKGFHRGAANPLMVVG
ncbi:MAG TPA: formate dehydrogenase accessory protein FdhE [Acetobacteraceae bacterium]|nr:formate dehydrogenase accessory protein FdhE [Acetobacteraceae bacterium]